MSLNLTTEQLDLLRKLLSNTHLTKGPDTSTTNPTVSIAQKGNMKDSFLSRKMNGNCWIVDIGAFDHMTDSMAIINKFQPSDKNLKVLMVDGVMSLVIMQSSLYYQDNSIAVGVYNPTVIFHYNLSSVG